MVLIQLSHFWNSLILTYLTIPQSFIYSFYMAKKSTSQGRGHCLVYGLGKNQNRSLPSLSEYHITRTSILSFFVMITSQNQYIIYFLLTTLHGGFGQVCSIEGVIHESLVANIEMWSKMQIMFEEGSLEFFVLCCQLECMVSSK